MEGNIVFGHELVKVHLGEYIGGDCLELPTLFHTCPHRQVKACLLVLDSSTISPTGLYSWL